MKSEQSLRLGNCSRPLLNTFNYLNSLSKPIHHHTLSPLRFQHLSNMAFHTRSPFRAFLQCPATLRPTLYRTFTSTAVRPYYSYEHDEVPPYPEPESTILSAALTHVPLQGFTQSALRSGLRDTGYRDASANLFPRGEFEVVLYHLTTRRLGLKHRVQFGEDERRVGRKVRALVLERLRANIDAGVVPRWQEVCDSRQVPITGKDIDDDDGC